MSELAFNRVIQKIKDGHFLNRVYMVIWDDDLAMMFHLQRNICWLHKLSSSILHAHITSGIVTQCTVSPLSEKLSN